LDIAILRGILTGDDGERVPVVIRQIKPVAISGHIDAPLFAASL
jgi:hypothetical protein